MVPWLSYQGMQVSDGMEAVLAHYRLNPRNGICLCPIHDSAFDKGMLLLDEGLRWRTVPPLARKLERNPYDQFFGRYEGREMTMPERWTPDLGLVEWHRKRSLEEAG